ncbi:MAG: aminotransferase class IV [Coriobacteriia bacterium]|nr:aminotransferase class IV [Coriobacteriia bacterium]
MKHVGYYNGTIGPLEEMQIPLLDRVSFYGDGVYDATMTRDGVILYLDDHLDRFFNSMRLMRFQPNFTREELAADLQRVVDAADDRDLFLYWQITRGTGLRQHAFLPGVEPNLWIYASPCPYADLEQSVAVITVEDTRHHHCNVKTLNLLPNVMAQQAADEAGASEAVFVRDGVVTETAHSNVHILKDGTLITHAADNLILPGIARKHLIAMCHELGIPVQETGFTRQEMLDADEIIISASSTFAQRVHSVDGQPAGCKDAATYLRLRDALQAEFEAYIAAGTAER